MRILLGLFLGGAALAGELISFGVKGGLPLSDAFEVAASQNVTYAAPTKRYTVGPAVELHLPFGLGIEFNALYKHLSFESQQDLAANIVRATTSDAWDFPLLLKVRLAPGLARPYVSAGPTFRRLSNLSQVERFFTGQRETDRPAELRNRFTAGFTLAGGLELRAPVVAISPEIRYTRFGWETFRGIGNVFRSNEDQLEFLIGITF